MTMVVIRNHPKNGGDCTEGKYWDPQTFPQAVFIGGKRNG